MQVNVKEGLFNVSGDAVLIGANAENDGHQIVEKSLTCQETVVEAWLVGRCAITTVLQDSNWCFGGLLLDWVLTNMVGGTVPIRFHQLNEAPVELVFQNIVVCLEHSLRLSEHVYR